MFLGTEGKRTLFWSVRNEYRVHVSFLRHCQMYSLFKHKRLTHCPFTCLMHSINALGVDIAPFSAMPHEAEILLLPGLPLVNRTGKNPEPDLWTFEVETPGAPDPSKGAPPRAMIDYVHPGECTGS